MRTEMWKTEHFGIIVGIESQLTSAAELKSTEKKISTRIITVLKPGISSEVIQNAYGNLFHSLLLRKIKLLRETVDEQRVSKIYKRAEVFTIHALCIYKKSDPW